MYTQEQCRGLSLTVISRVTLLVVGSTATFFPGWAAQGQTGSAPSSSIGQSNTSGSHTHMSEALRSTVKKVVVLPGPSPANQAITGSYEKDTPGLVGGTYEGSRIGNVSKEVGGVAVNIPIPVLAIPGAIVGGISGTTKREIQELRDALTEDLAQAANQPLTNDKLALGVYGSLRNVPGLDSKLFASTTPIPNDTDAILYVSVKDVTIEVQGKEAILTTSAGVTLRRLSDGKDLYERVIQYQDRDTLSNWTENENALWHDYANFAHHYLGREISAEVFDRIELRHELRPKESDTVDRVKKNEWQGVSRSTSPTLAWELTLLGGDSYGSWANAIDESDIYYDVEIYDMHRLVYAEKQVQDPHHTLVFEIDACKTYRWSVRPSYHLGSEIKFGEWMRFNSDTDTDTDTAKGSVGKKASEAPAYIRDFASLKVKCGRR
jgi:hypothetical protein